MRERGFVLALLGLTTCGSDPLLLVDVTLPDGLAPRQLRAYAYPTPLRDYVGLRQQVPALVPGTTRQFALRLLQSTSSQAQVTVQAIASEDGCVAAVGNAQMTVPLGTGPGPYKVQVTLDRLNLHRCDSDGQQQKMTPPPPMKQVNAITVLPGPVVYAVGNGGQVRRWTPQQGFIQVEIPGLFSDLTGVFGFDEGNLWIVGERGTLLKRQPGGGFAPEDVAGIAGIRMNGIDGSSDQVWVVGEKGTVLWRNGNKWTKLAPTTTDLNAVRATDAIVLLAGNGGTVLQGAPGSSMFTAVTGFPGAIDLRAITAKDDKFWLAGAGGQIRTLRNGTVESVTSGVGELLNAAWASRSGAVLVAGEKGALLACNPTCAPWTPWSAELRPKHNLRAIAGAPGQTDLWLAGGEVQIGEEEEAGLLQRTEQP